MATIRHKRSGRYRDKVILERLTTVTDAAGEIDNADDDNWLSLGRRSAAVQPVDGSEYWNRGQQQAFTFLKVDLQYDSLTKTLTTKDRLRFGTRKLDIESVFNVGSQNRVISLACMEPA